MVSVTASTFKDLINNSDLANATAEKIIDQAADSLNVYLEENNQLPNMSGTAGSKTVSVSSAQRGALMNMAREVYAVLYVNPTGVVSSQLGAASSSYGTNRLREAAKDIALALSSMSSVTEIEASLG